MNAVSGRGETFKSGGRVVKNVTGYDLCKLIAGSWGTLAAMTDVTIKTLPKAETEATILVLGLDDVTARKVMAAAMGSFGDVSAAAHLPAAVAARIAETAAAQVATTAFRLEGVAPSVAQRKAMLEKLLAPFGSLGTLARSAVARVLARGARCDAVRGVRGRGRARPLAHFDGAVAAAATSAARLAETGGRGNSLRLGRRPDLGGAAGRGRRRRAAGACHASRPPAAMPRSSARRPRCAPRSTCSRPSPRRLPH